ncbi:MAG: acetylornithine aminotransferase [Acidobacteria bacterium RIFCSPLOWO2_12_FULL_54_10]|nr:MAG: acetylornithine aminotransferase [Acidobacteria bacterium RIFCSPLOWO2_12_FULL_54_10]
MKQSPVELEKKYLMQTYARLPVVLERGKGCWVWDTKGKKYLDFVSGLAVNALGHAHPRILKVIREQAAKAIHLSNLYYHPYQGPLAVKLTKLTKMDRAFFCNSGTEAVEGALKLARAYAGNASNGKFEVVALDNSFHGRTMGALSATGQAKYRKDFEPMLPGVRFVKFNDWRDLEKKVTDKTCAILVEPIQGEGGIQEITQGFMRAVGHLAKKHKALLIADEIQCGMGRTGPFLAMHAYPVKPDIVLLAKPLGGGLPLGAILAREEVAAAFTPGMHGTTFGGGPLACRVAMEFLDILKEEKILENVRTVGKYFQGKLEALKDKHAIIREVRGRGLMQAIDLNAPSKPYVERALAKGVILNSTHDTVLRFLPPFIVGKKEVDIVCKTLDEMFAEK